ncbi:MAG: IPT/TIG domain-containing protein [Actinomycetota bacterium]|nr:IPT/TIG domain-containing protein [Actinomycetota bacterium]
MTASLGAAPPAVADHADGAPAFDGTEGLPYSPPSVPTTGGPIRIYGSGFHGVTSVTFGGTSATFAVIDSKLILAQVPSGGTNNTYVSVVVTDPIGSASNSNFLYTNGTVSINASTGIDDNESVAVTVDGHIPNIRAVVAQSSKLVAYAEPRPTALPPPYVDSLAVGDADANGDFSTNVTVQAEPDFNTDGDPAAQCPPTQAQANVGLGKCAMAWSVFGKGIIQTDMGMTGDSTPWSPTFTLSNYGPYRGTSVSFSGGGQWIGNPNFGSSTSGTLKPGETALTIDLCNLDLSSCVATTSPSAAVALTRYTGSAANFSNGTLSGATISGSFTIPNTGCTGVSNCKIRVRQQVFGAASGTYLTQSTTISVNE